MTWTKQLLTAIAVRLHEQGAGVWKPPGTGVYAAGDIAITLGRLPSTPDRAIALAAYGVDQFADDPVNTDSTQGVQARIRGAREDPTSVDDIADAVFNALHGWQNPAAGIILCTRRINAPMGVDTNQRWERADSYHLLCHRPTTLRPG
ncbi:minor capsid protein [Nonomuraea sp. NPDC005650]|uniref:minor capsid protein n=1 Tax=Nonomuraea sp. NPDC005650 TaxID=3157045 RepID=UPI0033A8773B